MYDRKVLKLAVLGLVVLFLAAISAYPASGSTAPAVQISSISDNPPPEVRDVGYSYGYMEQIPAPGRALAEIDAALLQEIDLRLLAAEAQPAKLDWTPVRRVTVHPTNPQILFAAIDNWNGIWKSTNGGGFWTKLPIGFANGRTVVFANDNTTALATFGFFWEPNPDEVYFLNSGVYISHNGGESWDDVSAGIGSGVVSAAFDPLYPSRIYAATRGGGIYRTTSSGSSWEPINTGLLEGDFDILSIAVSPSNRYVLYAGTYDSVYRSDNRGDSWYIADSLYPADYTEAIAVHPTDPDTFYAGAQRLVQDDEAEHTPSGFFKSTDGAGAGDLVLKNNGMEDTFVLDIEQDPVHDNILYAGTWGSGLYRSDDGGDNWYQVNKNLYNRYIYAVEAIANGADTILYLATFYTNSGVFKSLDRGVTWTEISAGSDLYPTMFDIATINSPNMLAAATSRGAFWSTDGGSTWSPSTGLVGGEHGMVLGLAHLPDSSKLLAATYGGGVWTSPDAGQNWTETSSGLGRQEIFDVIFSPSESNTAYAATEGVYRSDDGGANWSRVGASSLGDWVRALDAAGGPPADVFAGASISGVYWLPGSATSWLPINAGLTEQRIRAMKAVAADQLFAGTNGGSAWEYTFSTSASDLTDRREPAAVEGVNFWTKSGPYLTEPAAPGVIQIAIDPDDPDIIYAGTDQGVYRSTDGGETWTPKNKNLGGYGALVISGLAIDPSNTTTIYLGTWGYGLYRSTDSGDTWERLFDPLKMSQLYLPLVLRNYSPPRTEVVLSETFEGTFPGEWIVADTNSEDDLYSWGKRNCRPYSGSYSAWAAGAGSTYLSCYSDYKDNMTAWMISPPFSLADASGAVLSLKLWLNLQDGVDKIWILGSDDFLNFYGGYIDEDTSGWGSLTVDLGDLMGYDISGSPEVWFALIFQSDGSITEPEGAYVDDIVITAYSESATAPSMETEGTLPITLHKEPAAISRP